MHTGILLTTPGQKNRFWVPCRDAQAGLKEMSQAAWLYGAAWNHPDTVIEFGTVDGNEFLATEQLYPKPLTGS